MSINLISSKIKILGKIHDPNEEIEIFSENEFGFNVKFIYKRVERSSYILYTDNEMGTFHNVTEFHYLYDVEHNSIACESDIHGTGSGGYERALHVKKITVTKATKLYKSF